MFGMTALMVMAIAVATFFALKSRARSLCDGELSRLHSRSVYHGAYGGIVTGLAGLATAIVASGFFNYSINNQLHDALPPALSGLKALDIERLIIDAKQLALGGVVGEAANDTMAGAREQLAAIYKQAISVRNAYVPALALLATALGGVWSWHKVAVRFRARNATERVVKWALAVAATLAVITTFGILLSLIGETLKFFSDIPAWKFLFGTHWAPLSGVFQGKVDENTVGAVPLFAGTALITVIAMLVAVPIGLLSAIYLSEYATPKVRSIAKPMLEILAGIPTVVYGFFAALTVAPAVRAMGEALGFEVSAQSALAAGLVMGIMIIPFISSLSDDVINAVPQALRDGSSGLGATRAETVLKVVLPAAMPGIVSAVILAVSRAVGETMIVVMAAGQGARLTANPFEAVTTVTVQIVALINGDTDAGTAAGPAFSLGFTLFFVTMALNLLALHMVRKYRQKYD